MRLILSAFGLAAALGLMPAALAEEPPAVAVTAIVEHPALDATRDGIQAALADHGLVAGENLDWTFESAQGDTGTAAQIARQFVGEQPDVIVAIATPSAQAAAAAARGTLPVVFSAVTDPVAARLVDDPARPGGNITGVTDMLPLDRHLDLIRTVLPEARVLGVPYNPGEANAVALVEALKAQAPEQGFEVVTAAAPSSNDVLSAARALAGQEVDALYVTTDNTIVSALEAVVKVGQEAGIPVFAGDTASVPRGAVAAVGFDYHDIGRQTGEIVWQILQGTAPGDIPVQGVEKTDLVVNPKAAEAMGVTLPAALMDRATLVE